MIRTALAFATACLAGAATLWLAAESRAEELVSYQIMDEISIPEPLTSEAGDAARGRAVAIDRKQGNCLACHTLPIPEQSFHGETGPDLSGVGSRYTIDQLRLRVVNPKVLNPDTMMPAFYRTEGLHRVAKNFQGKPILTAQQVEDVIAYLATLKEE